jgi:2-C-methyl-D-erythritol 2,4-cyclodiphosphate synthase
MSRVRVGQGFDVHRFSDDPARALVLGGVTFEGQPGLVGHSDADAVAHAVAEAVLGAAGLGDIGQHFPDTDPRWSGVDSLLLLRLVARLVHEAGWEVGNVDCAVVCEIPKLAPHRTEMQRRLSDAIGGPVTVKGRRAEGLGAIGRSEGVACWAVALLTSDVDADVDSAGGDDADDLAAGAADDDSDQRGDARQAAVR